eukprot:CAMPEP_0180735706 /NCGR_PEP_ID=MMETSP1038_2-20121128/23375_1 /TAXON_ID=632150 /ORGANISM="Azadinium spinosum, Strain 3D9" /LENGTH=228 /DNA_ID=CAMNT_0022768709 /DNA_START=53 /DNA_END=740 /DNA_ORIENTATION=+
MGPWLRLLGAALAASLMVAMAAPLTAHKATEGKSNIEVRPAGSMMRRSPRDTKASHRRVSLNAAGVLQEEDEQEEGEEGEKSEATRPESVDESGSQEDEQEEKEEGEKSEATRPESVDESAVALEDHINANNDLSLHGCAKCWTCNQPQSGDPRWQCICASASEWKLSKVTQREVNTYCNQQACTHVATAECQDMARLSAVVMQKGTGSDRTTTPEPASAHAPSPGTV